VIRQRKLYRRHLLGALSIFVILIVTPSSNAKSSASATADAKAKVVASITIKRKRDLDFGEGSPGDSAKSVASTDPSAAQFSLTGEANKAYDVFLPSSIKMVRAGGDSGNGDDTISVNTFTSDPSGSGNLGASGNQTLGVGATRASLSVTQATGNYSGSFTVTVAYQ